MKGISLNNPIKYLHSSLRIFENGEKHIDRFCEENVLLLVYDGILYFSENGENIQVSPGEYYIQKANMYQKGVIPSQSPKYLYVHFYAQWSNGEDVLPYKGSFNYPLLKEKILLLDELSHSHATYIEKACVFYQILTSLKTDNTITSTSDQIAQYIQSNFRQTITLKDLCHEFGFSKNHIINLFKKDYHSTPIEYMNNIKILNAKRLMETTSLSLEEIINLCGFNNYSHFYRLFVRENRISPLKWRDNKRLNPII